MSPTAIPSIFTPCIVPTASDGFVNPVPRTPPNGPCLCQLLLLGDSRGRSLGGGVVFELIYIGDTLTVIDPATLPSQFQDAGLVGPR
jgi:hypothetical protein